MIFVRWILALALAALFLFMGVSKFLPEINGGANPIFTLLAENTGIALVDPYFRWITGAIEILVALFLVIPRTRFTGASIGLFVLLGALAAHFSPYLGIDVPGVGKMIFYLALGMTALSSVVLMLCSALSHKPAVVTGY